MWYRQYKIFATDGKKLRFMLWHDRIWAPSAILDVWYFHSRDAGRSRAECQKKTFKKTLKALSLFVVYSFNKKFFCCTFHIRISCICDVANVQVRHCWCVDHVAKVFETSHVVLRAFVIINERRVTHITYGVMKFFLHFYFALTPLPIFRSPLLVIPLGHSNPCFSSQSFGHPLMSAMKNTKTATIGFMAAIFPRKRRKLEMEREGWYRNKDTDRTGTTKGSDVFAL